MRNQEKSGLPPMMVRRIKALQGLAALGEEDYRALLWGYGVESCKALDVGQARQLIEVLQQMVNRIPEKRPAPKRFAEIGGRHVLMATERQLRMLEGMWMQITQQTTTERAREALAEWVHRRYGIGSVVCIRGVVVGILLGAVVARGGSMLGGR